MSERSAYEPAKTPRPRQSTPPLNWTGGGKPSGAVARAYHLAVVEKLEARIAELEKEAEKLDCLVSDLDRALRELVDADDELPTEYLADEMNDARRLLSRRLDAPRS